MKNGKACSKCSHTTLMQVPGNIGAYGAGNNIAVGWRAMKAVPVTRFVCARCGFVEEWITEASDLERLRERFLPAAAGEAKAAPAAKRKRA